MGITIQPVLFVSSGAGTVQGEGYVVKDFRPTVHDADLQVKGPIAPAIPAIEPEVIEEGSDPKGSSSDATGSASDSDKETSGKSTQDSETTQNPAPNPIPPLVLSGGAASVVKGKSATEAPSMSGGKNEPPAAE